MKKILIVDDDSTVREMFRYLLADLGYKVETAKTGWEGLEKVIAGRPDLILTDISMPEMTGTEFVTTLREHPDAMLRSIPFIVLTGETRMDSDAQYAFQQNPACRAFFAKDTDQETVVNVITKVIGPP